jgi:hypothetical protein
VSATDTKGRVRLDPGGVVLEIRRMDSASLEALAPDLPARCLLAHALAHGERRRVESLCKRVGGDLAVRARALLPSEPVSRTAAPAGPGSGESPAEAADRLASEGRHREAFGLDPGVRDRWEGRAPSRCRALSLEGLDAFVLGRRLEALARFRQAIDADPYDGEARLNLARLLLEFADRNRSRVLLRKILREAEAALAFRPGLEEAARIRDAVLLRLQ